MIVASAGLGVTGCVRQPDVQILGVTEPPTRLRPGSSPVAADALRVGGRKAAFVVRYYLSADSKQSKDDHLVGTRETAELAAKAVDSGPAPLTIPDDVPERAYHLLACGSLRTSTSVTGAHCRASARTAVVGRSGRTSRDLIGAARSAGTLDYVSSLRYRLYAILGDSHLPAAYHADPSEDPSVVEEIQAAVTAAVPGADQLEPLLARPAADDAGPAASRPTPGGTPLPSPSPSSPPGGNDPVIDIQGCQGAGSSWIGRTKPGGHFKVWECVLSSAPPSAASSQVLDLTERFWTAMTRPEPDGLGRPLPDFRGGDDRVDVYLTAPQNQCVYRYNPKYDCIALDRTTLGKAVSERYRPARLNGYGHEIRTGYMLISRALVANPQRLQRTFVHEFFHLQQFAHNVDATDKYLYTRGEAQFDVSWYQEATAMWAQWRYVPAGSLDLHNSWFVDNFQRVDKPTSLLQVDRSGRTGTNHDYASYIWPFFTQQESSGGARAVFESWADIERAGDPDGIDAVLDQRFPFASNFADFAVRNVNTDHPGRPYKLYGELDPAFPVNKPPRWSNTPIVTSDQPVPPQPVDIPSLSAQYDRVSTTSSARRITFDFGGVGPADRLRVDALLHVGNTWRREKVTGGRLVLCRDKPEEDVSEVLLVLSNVDHTPGVARSARPPVVSGDYGIATAKQCAGWTGQVTVKATGSGPLVPLGQAGGGTENWTLSHAVKVSGGDQTREPIDPASGDEFRGGTEFVLPVNTKTSGEYTADRTDRDENERACRTPPPDRGTRTVDTEDHLALAGSASLTTVIGLRVSADTTRYRIDLGAPTVNATGTWKSRYRDKDTCTGLSSDTGITSRDDNFLIGDTLMNQPVTGSIAAGAKHVSGSVARTDTGPSHGRLSNSATVVITISWELDYS